MRRYVFYLAVAILAFGFGSAVVFKFYWNMPQKKLVAEQTLSVNFHNQKKNDFTGDLRNQTVENKNLHSSDKIELTCKDKQLLPVWNELKKDKEFQERETEFYKNTDCSEILELQNIDLNDDGQKEFILWGRNSPELCGATGNCAIWIYEKKKGKYNLLLRSAAYNDTTKWFEVKKAKSKGYRNILLKSHFTAAETTYVFYRFNGAKYVEEKCLFEIYSMTRENPTIMTCKEYSEETEKQLRESEKRLKNQ